MGKPIEPDYDTPERAKERDRIQRLMLENDLGGAECARREVDLFKQLIVGEGGFNNLRHGSLDLLKIWVAKQVIESILADRRAAKTEKATSIR